jgi:hypothetical protein
MEYGMLVVGVRCPGSDWRIIYRGYSRPYALSVCRKWLKLGCDVNLETIQQDDED